MRAAPDLDPLSWLRARRAGALLPLLAGALLAVTAARLPAAWESGNALNHVSGAWMTLADDLARGTFYRPLHETELEFGGTRFFPLSFSLHAALLRAGVPLLAAGYALSLAAGVLLLAASFLLLRRIGLARPLAAAFAALTLAGFAGQHALTAIRGDLLAVGLQVLGLAVVARGAGGRARRASPGVVLLAAGAFVLAFAAKPTALTAPAAAVAFLTLRGQGRIALALALGTAGGAAAVTLATDALSDGRFLSILAACAAGGAGPGDLARAPLRLARTFLVADRAGLLLVTVSAAALLAARPRTLAGWRAPGADALLLAALWLGAALGGVLLVMASPGTGVNHLLEVEAAGAVALGACAAAPGRRGALGTRQLAPAAILTTRQLAPAAALAGAVLAGALWHTDLRTSRLAELRAVLAEAPAGTLLSEDPLVPLLAGERPLLLDPWMLRLAAARDADLARPLLEALRGGELAAVVLFQDLSDPEADGWYARGHLGSAPIAEIRARYLHAAREGRYHLYVPAPREEEEGGRRRVVLAGPAPVEPPGTGSRPGAGEAPEADADRAPAAAGAGASGRGATAPRDRRRPGRGAERPGRRATAPAL